MIFSAIKFGKKFVEMVFGGKPLSVQNPLPVDGDSIYVKDVDIDNSDSGNFDGSVLNLFDSLKTIIEDTTNNNPKTIVIRFNRSIQTSSVGFGCDDIAKSFSNIKLKIIGSADEIRQTVDESTNNTKYNSRVLEFAPDTANGLIIEFHTSDTICLSNLIIYKSQNRISRLQAIKPNGLSTDIGATNNNNLRVSVQEYGDTPAVDAFARLRVSENFTIFDSKQLHDKQPLFWDEELGGSATSTHNSVNACVEMNVTANTSDYVIRQTKQRFNYQPGKSQLIFMTFYCPQTTGTTKRIGCFDGIGVNFLTPNNGIFFETDGVLSWNIAKNGIITESASQDNWNVDKLDGNGPSGIVYNPASTQILVIDYEWLGVGRVRVGFVINGLVYYVHYFNHANISGSSSVYMSTPNLPLRYSIETNGSAGCTLNHICSSVISEGGIEKTGILRAKDTGNDHVNASSAGDNYAIVGIKLKELYKDITIIPEALSIINENNDDFRRSLCLNPTLDSPLVYSDLPNSATQGARGTGQQVTDEGIILASGYASIDTLSANAQLQTALKIGSTIDGTLDELVLCVVPLSNGADIQAALNFRELL